MEADKERRAVMPTVDSIRGHLITPAEADQLLASPVCLVCLDGVCMSPGACSGLAHLDEADQLLASLRPRARFSDVCMLDDCGCSGLAHP